MAYIQDSSQSFTITLTALLEGRGILVWIEVINNTTGEYGYWDGATWYRPIPETTEGDDMYVYVEVENTGATTDTLFAEFSSPQVSPASPLQEMPNLLVGDIDSVEWNFAMPPSNVSITINAGHVE